MPINIKYQYLSLIKVKSFCSDIRQIIACLTLLPWVHFFLIRQHQKTLLLLYRGHIALRALVAELLLLVVGGCIGFCWPNGWCWKLSSRNGRREMQRKIALPPSFAFFFVAFYPNRRSKKGLSSSNFPFYSLCFENLKPETFFSHIPTLFSVT